MQSKIVLCMNSNKDENAKHDHDASQKHVMLARTLLLFLLLLDESGLGVNQYVVEYFQLNMLPLRGCEFLKKWRGGEEVERERRSVRQRWMDTRLGIGYMISKLDICQSLCTQFQFS